MQRPGSECGSSRASWCRVLWDPSTRGRALAWGNVVFLFTWCDTRPLTVNQVCSVQCWGSAQCRWVCVLTYCLLILAV